MSNTSHKSDFQHKDEHGTMQSYVIGFLLSLLFTAIPYYMVVNKTASGGMLLGTIIGIALLQMIIQIVFFLHLGRGPKPLYNIVFFCFTFVTILIVVVASIWIMNHLNYNMAPTDISKKLIQKEGIYQIDGEKTGACQGTHINHKVIISNGKAGPGHTEARICDTLTFINEDDEVREITFGDHSSHSYYAGEIDLTVRKGRAKTITLSEAGTYQFHDHLNPDIAGSFTVLEY